LASSLLPKSPRKEGSLRDSEGMSKESNKHVVNPDVPLVAIDTSEFLASDYVTTDAALAKEILAKARKPSDTVVGKVLLVYRKKETDPCPEASHIVTIRQIDGLRTFFITEQNKAKLYKDKNGEVELKVCGDWVIDVEKIGTKTKKGF